MAIDSITFQKIFEGHYDRMYLYALHFLRDEDMARDVMSNVFTNVWEHRETMAEATAISYIQSMVRSRCIDILRHETIKREYSEEYLKSVDEAYENDSIVEENCRIVDDMLAALPAETGEILRLCYIENMKYKEVSAMLGIHTDTVKRHIMRALKFLRENKEKFKTM